VEHIVGISDMKLADKPEDSLITYALGSCIGVTLFDPKRKVGGLVHCLLPFAKSDVQLSKNKPGTFVDTGVATLIKMLLDGGSEKTDLIACVAGGANLIDANNKCNIGDRNYAVVRKILWKNSILIAAESVGGSIPRTMYIEIGDGSTHVRSGDQSLQLVTHNNHPDVSSLERDRVPSGVRA